MTAVDEVLAAAAALDPRPSRADLAGLAAMMPGLAEVVDAAGLASTMVDSQPRLVLGEDGGGRMVALRRYAAGEASTVHEHGWAVLLQLSTETAFERWAIGADGATARLQEVERMGPGTVVVLTDGEAHRQPASADGSVELVVFAGYGSPAPPRVDHEPDPADLAAATLIAGFVDAYRRADASAVAALCAPDVTVDVNVPQARFPLTGAAQVATALGAEEFVPGYRVVAWRGRPGGHGAVVELDCRFGGAGSRQLHLLTADEEGRITDWTLFCTGIWEVP